MLTEVNINHTCAGVVMYAEDTERAVGSFYTKADAEKAAQAINSYDQHVELIAKQAEQIKMLREAVGFVIPKIEILDVDAMGASRMHNVQPWSVRDEVLSKLDAALSATEQK